MPAASLVDGSTLLTVDPELAELVEGRIEADNPAEAGSHDQAGSHEADSAASGTLTAAADDRATHTVAALEQWLAAIHVSREQPHP